MFRRRSSYSRRCQKNCLIIIIVLFFLCLAIFIWALNELLNASYGDTANYEIVEEFPPVPSRFRMLRAIALYHPRNASEYFTYFTWFTYSLNIVQSANMIQTCWCLQQRRQLFACRCAGAADRYHALKLQPENTYQEQTSAIVASSSNWTILWRTAIHNCSCYAV